MSDTDEKLAISELVEEVALEIFDLCGTKDDYCVQAVGRVAVFGGVNRLIFSPRYGWRIDKADCTPAFRKNWERIRREYRA